MVEKMLNILLRELNKNRRAFIIWVIAITLLNFLPMSVFPSLANDTKAIEELMKALPKELISAFGLDKLDMSEILGYYATKGYFYVVLFGTIYTSILASSILAKEESEKTIEFLLAKPITRKQIVTGKLAALLIYIVLFNLLVSLGTYISFEMFKIKDYDLKRFLLLAVGVFLVQVTFATLSYLISVFITKSKTAYPISIGLVITGYILSVISSISPDLEKIKYLTPFKYVDAVDILLKGRIEPGYLVTFAILNIIFVAATYFFYQRKDISV
jgi:ABC-2 type transport system permease protein